MEYFRDDHASLICELITPGFRQRTEIDDGVLVVDDERGVSVLYMQAMQFTEHLITYDTMRALTYDTVRVSWHDTNQSITYWYESRQGRTKAGYEALRIAKQAYDDRRM